MLHDQLTIHFQYTMVSSVSPFPLYVSLLLLIPFIHYITMLQCIFLCPFYFFAIYHWRYFIKGLLAQRTVDKVSIQGEKFMSELSKRVSVENIPSLVKGGGFNDDGTVYNFDTSLGGLLGDLGEVVMSPVSVPPPALPSPSIHNEQTTSQVKSAVIAPITTVATETVQPVATTEFSADPVPAVSIGLTEGTLAATPVEAAAVPVVEEAIA